MSRPPLLLIVSDDPADHRVARETLTYPDWQVDHVNDAAAALERAQICRYALILVGIRSSAGDGFGVADAIRRSGGASASAPIVVICAMPQIEALAAVRACGIDGHIARPATPAAFRAAAERWRPAPASTRVTRLAAAFGAAEIAALMRGLRNQLEAQLAIDDRSAAHGGAHRLAGIAGTLGFPDLSRLWLAVSEGDATAYAEARMYARKALVEIDANAMACQPSQTPGAGR
jgi:CheY-like chemotaxis protein